MPTADAQYVALVRKYNRPGPRYTSYPPIPHFTADFGAAEFKARLEAIGGGSAELESEGEAGRTSELSLYVHVPFCRSLCYYCGCHMLVTSRRERIDEYLRYVRREIDLTARHVAGSLPVGQLHWGGGTPTYLTPAQISELMGHLRARFVFAADAEISLEADPRGLSPAHLQSARDAGFTRLSLGVQDFNDDVQKAINREQSVEMVRRATDVAKAIGFAGVSYDLIYGLPHQSVESFSETLEEVIRLGPDRISLFSYAHVPWKKKHQRVIEDDWLPTAEEKIRIFLRAREMLTTLGGYRFVGMDHFARPDDPLVDALEHGTLQRNFQGYSTRAGSDLIGFGISAISRIRDAYAQNVLGLNAYYDAIGHDHFATAQGYVMTEDDRLRAEVIEQLMCRLTLNIPAIESKYGIDFWTYFSDALRELREMESDGLITLRPESLCVSETGRFFIRNLAMAFDAYLRSPVDTPARYSATV